MLCLCSRENKRTSVSIKKRYPPQEPATTPPPSTKPCQLLCLSVCHLLTRQRLPEQNKMRRAWRLWRGVIEPAFRVFFRDTRQKKKLRKTKKKKQELMYVGGSSSSFLRGGGLLAGTTYFHHLTPPRSSLTPHTNHPLTPSHASEPASSHATSPAPPLPAPLQTRLLFLHSISPPGSQVGRPSTLDSRREGGRAHSKIKKGQLACT